MTAIRENHLPVLKKLVQHIGANNWTKLMDAQNLPELDIIEIDGATIYLWYHEDEIVESMCVKYLGPELCEIIGDIDDIDQFVDTIDRLINIKV